MAVSRAITIFVVICTLTGTAAQSKQLAFSGDVPQAQTQEELDAWLDIVRAKAPSSIIYFVQEFLQQYPNSDFDAPALQYEIKALQDVDRVPETIAAARRLLQLRPNSIEAMIALARALPETAKNGPDPLLHGAQMYAQQALSQLASQRIPRSLTPERWNELRSEMETEIHLALARIAEKYGNREEARKETGIVLNSRFPDLQRAAKRELQRLQAGQPE